MITGKQDWYNVSKANYDNSKKELKMRKKARRIGSETRQEEESKRSNFDKMAKRKNDMDNLVTAVVLMVLAVVITYLI